MTDILERAKAILPELQKYCEKCTKTGPSECGASCEAAKILPELVAECERMQKLVIDERAKSVEIFWHPGIDMAKIPEMKREQAARELDLG